MDKSQIENLYTRLLTFWNQRDSEGMASLFSENANVIGFDGSQMNGKAEIQSELAKVFNNHKTSMYVWKIREIRFPSYDTAILRAVVGMIPPGDNDIKPDVNAIQSLIIIPDSGDLKITLFQNTPAKFDGRPELSKALTEELRKLL